MALPCHFLGEDHYWARWLEGEVADLIISGVTAGFFFVPIITSRLFGWPKRGKLRPVEQAEKTIKSETAIDEHLLDSKH